MTSRGRDGGVSLVELLVALTLTLGLAAMMVKVTGGTLQIWQRAQDAFVTDTEAKQVLDALERDFNAGVFRETGSTWLAVDVLTAPAQLTSHGWKTAGLIKPAGTESMQLVPPSVDGAPPDFGVARFGLSGAWLRLVTTNVEAKNSSSPGGSLPTIVSYQIARRPLSGSVSGSNPAAIRYSLFRSAVASDTSFVNGLDVTAAAYGSATSTAPAARSARSVTNPNLADAMASNVVDFAVWFYVRDATGVLQRIFPATSSDLSHVARTAAEYPEVVDVMVRVLTPEGAQRITALESATGSAVRPPGFNDAEWWWSVVETHSRVYCRRVQLKAIPR